jgi:hypothetical protein
MAYLDADDVVFPAIAAGETIGGAVLYRDAGSDATSPNLTFYDFTDTPTNGGAPTIQWALPANGGVIKMVGV